MILQDSQFEKMLQEMEPLLEKKNELLEEIKEVHTRYGLTPAWYTNRKKKALERNPELEEYILSK